MATHGTPYGLRAKANGRISAAGPGRGPVPLALSLLVLVVLLGCAHTPPSPLSVATQAQLGAIGVVAAQFTPEVDYRTPGRGGAGGAAIGVAKGVGLGVLGAAGCVLTYGTALPACGLAVVSPYLAVRYAVDQATEGVSPDTIAASETAITAVFAERSHQAAVQDEVVRVAVAQTGQSLVGLPGEGPRSAAETPRYTHLTAHGIDTVIEITLQRLALQSRTSGRAGGRQPPGQHQGGGTSIRTSPWPSRPARGCSGPRTEPCSTITRESIAGGEPRSPTGARTTPSFCGTAWISCSRRWRGRSSRRCSGWRSLRPLSPRRRRLQAQSKTGRPRRSLPRATRSAWGRSRRMPSPCTGRATWWRPRLPLTRGWRRGRATSM